MKELISLVVNNKKVEEGAECALGAFSGTRNAFDCRFCIKLMHSDFFQNLARPSKSPFCFQKVSILQFKMPKSGGIWPQNPLSTCAVEGRVDSREKNVLLFSSLWELKLLCSQVWELEDPNATCPCPNTKNRHKIFICPK